MNQQQIAVEYLDHLGTDLTVVNAARTSFGKESAWEPGSILEGDGGRKLKPADASLIRFLATGYRTSEWEALLQQIAQISIGSIHSGDLSELADILHAYKRKAQHFAHPHMQIRMTLPIFLARQFVKHQIGGVWSEESRRYISDEPGVWFPQEWHTRPEDIKQGSGGLVLDQHTAQAIAEIATDVALDRYHRLLKEGVAPEEARAVLPLNMMSTVTWTGSLLFWSRVCNQRLDSHAQLAAQDLAKLIADIAQPLFPVSWAALVGADTEVKTEAGGVP